MVFKAAVGMPKVSSTPKCCNSNPLPLLFFPFFFKRQKLAHARNCVWLSASVTSNVQHGPRENPALQLQINGRTLTRLHHTIMNTITPSTDRQCMGDGTGSPNFVTWKSWGTFGGAYHL